jgi:hypothetical protein
MEHPKTGIALYGRYALVGLLLFCSTPIKLILKGNPAE